MVPMVPPGMVQADNLLLTWQRLDTGAFNDKHHAR